MNAQHKIFRLTFLSLLCIGASNAALAQTASNFRGCAGISGATQRLDCFDAAARSAISPPPAPAIITPAAAAVPAPAPTSLPRDFGAETIQGSVAPSATANDDRIQSRLVGSFKGWWPGLRFNLENGQVWQYDGQDEANFIEQLNPSITVRRSAVGSYWLMVTGQTAEVQVRRLK